MYNNIGMHADLAKAFGKQRMSITIFRPNMVIFLHLTLLVQCGVTCLSEHGPSLNHLEHNLSVSGRKFIAQLVPDAQTLQSIPIR